MHSLMALFRLVLSLWEKKKDQRETGVEQPAWPQDRYRGLRPLLALAVVLPVETSEPLHNPLKGWAIIDHAIPGQIDAGQSVEKAKDGTPYEWYECAAILSTWAQIEPEPGVYDWSLMDKSVDFWTSAGKTLHLRFSTDDFGNIAACPRWLLDKGVPHMTRQTGGAFPDYTHPVYLEALTAFMAEFAAHFCDNPNIETIDLRAYGDWGEWHSGYNYPAVEERVKALRTLIDVWRAATAQRKLLCLSVSYEWQTPMNCGGAILPLGTSIYEEYRPTYTDFRHRSAFDYALPLPDIAIRRDGVGGAVFQEWDGRLIANFFQHYRKPVFTEFFGGPKMYRGPGPTGFPGTKEGDDFVDNALDEALSHHGNYASPMGWGPFGGALEFYNDDRGLVLKGHKLMGYRFALVKAAFPEQVAPGGRFTLEQTWENRALGRCYRPFPLAAYLMRGDEVVWSAIDPAFDQRNFLSGESYEWVSAFDLPQDLPEGEYELRIAMVDASGEPALHLAIEGADGHKRYALGKVKIEHGGEETGLSARPVSVQGDGTQWRCEEPLAPNADYLVSFRYRVTGNPSHDLHTESPGFFRFCAEADDGWRTGEARWFDKAGQPPAYKTFLVSTDGRAGYRLAWDAVGGGTIEIDGVRLDPLNAERVQRVAIKSNQVKLMNGASRYQDHRALCERERGQVQLPDDWTDFLATNPNQIKLAPDTVYTVWFTCAMRPQIWQGDYAYFVAKSAKAGAEGDRGFSRWTQRHTSNPVRHAYSFRTGPYEDYRLVWGIKNGGRAEIGNITIVRQ